MGRQKTKNKKHQTVTIHIEIQADSGHLSSLSAVLLVYPSDLTTDSCWYKAYSPGARGLVTRSLFIIFWWFSGQMTSEKLVTLGSCLVFCASGKYRFSRRLIKRAETANYFSANQNRHPVSTALVSSKMNTTGTKTFTSEWVLFGRLIITMRDVLTVCCSHAFIILRRLISGNIERLAPDE